MLVKQTFIKASNKARAMGVCRIFFFINWYFKAHFLFAGIWYPERSCEFIWCCIAWRPVCFYSLRGVFFCWLQNSNYLKLFSKDYTKPPKILMQLRTSTIRHALLVRDKLEAPWSNGRCGGLVVCVHDFGSNGSGSSLSPGQGHCVMFLDKTQSLFSPRCINGYRRS